MTDLDKAIEYVTGIILLHNLEGDLADNPVSVAGARDMALEKHAKGLSEDPDRVAARVSEYAVLYDEMKARADSIPPETLASAKAYFLMRWPLQNIAGRDGSAEVDWDLWIVPHMGCKHSLAILQAWASWYDNQHSGTPLNPINRLAHVLECARVARAKS